MSALHYVNFSDVLLDYGLNKVVSTGMTLTQQYIQPAAPQVPALGPFIRGSWFASTVDPVRQAYPTINVVDYWPFVSGSEINIEMWVRTSSLDLTSPLNWYSFITVALDPAATRTVEVRFDTTTKLYMTNVPTQGARTGVGRSYTYFPPSDEWFKLRLSINLNTRVVNLYYNCTLSETGVIDMTGPFRIYSFHFGYTSLGSVTSGVIDNRLIQVGIIQ